jgi:tRNA G18 (ribose-2'-O)-methylase SpoU
MMTRKLYRYSSERPSHSNYPRFLFVLKATILFLVVAIRIWRCSSLSTEPPFRSRSTACPDQSNEFAQGSEQRKERLHQALWNIGINPNDISDSSFTCSAALRAYTSFLLPKSEGAWAVAESPQRATVVANNIAYSIREHKAHEMEWLRNHDKCISEVTSPRTPITIILDNLRSAHNVGNIFRATEAARIERIILCGITPDITHPKVLKTAMGSAEYVPYERASSTIQVVRDLRQKGCTVLAVETTSRSKILWNMTPLPRPLAVIFGNELVGVHADVLDIVDDIVCLPTLGIKNSLNVGNCVSIVLWETLRQWKD